MKRVILTGGTGMVGGSVLKKCLESPAISEVISIVRKSAGIQHEKLIEVIHQDFGDYSSITEYFKDQDVAYFCLGAYTGAVSDDLFKKITVDFTAAFADMLEKHSPNVNFCFLSGEGADQTEKSRVSFAKYKGIAENHLLSKAFKDLYLFRPGYIYPVEPRQEPNVMYRISRALYPLLKTIYSTGVITSEELAQAIFQTGLEGTNQSLLKNIDIKKLLQ
ncbi:MAG: NAD(P)H-binding protein [Saprospiraceae bacterium]|nr:NAD(P)H-binding protein [Saprospiraceae bacterium]